MLASQKSRGAACVLWYVAMFCWGVVSCVVAVLGDLPPRECVVCGQQPAIAVKRAAACSLTREASHRGCFPSAERRVFAVFVRAFVFSCFLLGRAAGARLSRVRGVHKTSRRRRRRRRGGDLSHSLSSVCQRPPRGTPGEVRPSCSCMRSSPRPAFYMVSKTPLGTAHSRCDAHIYWKREEPEC